MVHNGEWEYNDRERERERIDVDKIYLLIQSNFHKIFNVLFITFFLR